MASIAAVRKVPLKDLVLGDGQVRARDTARDLDDLVESIRLHGLLEPIVICPAKERGKYEILCGLRRFLAHQRLARPTILAAIVDERVDEITGKTLSLTENLIRRDLNTRDVVDACTALYQRYGSLKAVMDETGIPYHKVRQYLKYDRLDGKLRTLVDAKEIDLRVALLAQDAATLNGRCDADAAVKLAVEMSEMTTAERRKLLQERKANCTAAVEEVIRAVKLQPQVTQILVTLDAAVHRGLREYAKEHAKEHRQTLDQAAACLIEEGLSRKRLLGRRKLPGEGDSRVYGAGNGRGIAEAAKNGTRVNGYGRRAKMTVRSGRRRA